MPKITDITGKVPVIGDKWFQVRIFGICPAGSTEEQATNTINRDISIAMGLMEFVKASGVSFHTQDEMQSLLTGGMLKQ